ncbi:MAG: hypothetical protein RJA54_129 [Pseudomonadota bacterium]
MKLESKIVIDFIKPFSKVLDVGCGDGSILLHLKKEKKIDARGIEIDHEKVKESLSKGLSVVEGDAEKDLVNYPDQSFDYVHELLRIGKNAIVSIPNFGYWKVRFSLLFKGRMPVTKTLPNTWHDTPNLHMCTIKDFFDLCHSDKINIIKSIAVTQDRSSVVSNLNLEIKNLYSEFGIFLISKKN